MCYSQENNKRKRVITMSSEAEKRQDFMSILIELSADQNVLSDSKATDKYFKRLEKIYDESFRHYYSDIFSSLGLIVDDNGLDSLDILAQNIRTLKDVYAKKRNKDERLQSSINKLYDHVNLDVSRLTYTHRIYGKLRSEAARNRSATEERLTELDKKSKDIEKQMESNRDIQRSMQSQYISILGIFAAIVLAFTGGMTFSGSVLSNLDQSTIYRIVLITLILGIVLFNVIWLLMDFIRVINKEKIRRVWIFWVYNGLFALGILLDILAYCNNWIEDM